MSSLTFVDACSGTGGLAPSLERAGFEPRLLLDEDDACRALLANCPP